MHSRSTVAARSFAAAPRATATPTPTPSPSASVASSVYKDGNYSATGTYNSPGGKDDERINVGPVAGSSLSSIGFNRAITTIKASAKN